jgi:hypothetical protein
MLRFLGHRVEFEVCLHSRYAHYLESKFDLCNNIYSIFFFLRFIRYIPID